MHKRQLTVVQRRRRMIRRKGRRAACHCCSRDLAHHVEAAARQRCSITGAVIDLMHMLNDRGLDLSRRRRSFW